MADKAVAYINGGTLYPNIAGRAVFETVPYGTEVEVEVYGLPVFNRQNGKIIGPHGFHLHDGHSCEPGSDELPFPAVGSHYNPDNQPHGNHAGDFPILYSNSGRAHMRFFTERFSVDDVIGFNVVIHEGPDDGHTQPGGNSGRMIACGVIREFVD